MQKVSTCLWFDTQAEEAAKFYCSIFKNSRVLNISRYGENARLPKGTPLVVNFSIDGTEFMALNGGPAFTFTPAVSLTVACETQAEMDLYWDKLIAGGGAPNHCGWLTDQYGLSWQIVPSAISRMMQDTDVAKKDRMMSALLQMKKLDIAALERAFEGAPAQSERA
jgi:predicted 3-demethylubiquinone-9 3-methyltransferase (glyoxalase superfamily)